MLFPRQADSCRCVGGDSFTAAGKAEPFARCRFHADTLGANSGKLGDIRAHGVAVCADPGGFAHDRKIQMGYAALSGAHALDSESKEAVGRCAAPLRVAWWEMRSDIAVRECTKNSIGQRVQCDVRVRIAGEGLRVRDTDPTQHYMIARTESMDIKARTGPYVTKHDGLRRLSAREIFRCGQLDIARLASKYAYGHARPFGERGVVREIVAALRGCPAVSVEQGIESKGLRR